MKQITTDQMKKLKGKLNDMDYNLSNLTNSTTVQATNDVDYQATICMAKAAITDD